jgi:hypothetical protein
MFGFTVGLANLVGTRMWIFLAFQTVKIFLILEGFFMDYLAQKKGPVGPKVYTIFPTFKPLKKDTRFLSRTQCFFILIFLIF